MTDTLLTAILLAQLVFAAYSVWYNTRVARHLKVNRAWGRYCIAKEKMMLIAGQTNNPPILAVKQWAELVDLITDAQVEDDFNGK